MFDVRRREFITLLGGAAAAWPLAARAQQPAKASRLGVLLYSTPQADPQMETVRRGLGELGYVEGQNLVISYRYAEGKPERLADLAAALVREKPDLLLALGGDVAPYAVKATPTIPIVFVSSADPVQLGLAASFARPAGNATGVTLLLDDTASKRMELLKEAVPRVKHVASFIIRIIPTMSCGKLSARRKVSTCDYNPWRCAVLAISGMRCVR